MLTTLAGFVRELGERVDKDFRGSLGELIDGYENYFTMLFFT